MARRGCASVPSRTCWTLCGSLAADAVSEAGTGCPPVVVRAAGLPGGRAEVAGNVSSQFLSAPASGGPLCGRRRRLSVRGELVSKPYVAMTLAVMRAFGVESLRDAGACRQLEPALHRAGAAVVSGRTYAIEPDASAASYFFAAAAIAGGSVTVEGLSRDSLQGDVAFCDCLRQMGCEVVGRRRPDHGDRTARCTVSTST